MWSFIAKRGLWETRQGHASKLDTWLLRITMKTGQKPHFHDSTVVAAVLKCAAKGYTLLRVLTVGSLIFAPKFSRFGLQKSQATSKL